MKKKPFFCIIKSGTLTKKVFFALVLTFVSVTAFGAVDAKAVSSYDDAIKNTPTAEVALDNSNSCSIDITTTWANIFTDTTTVTDLISTNDIAVNYSYAVSSYKQDIETIWQNKTSWGVTKKNNNLYTVWFSEAPTAYMYFYDYSTVMLSGETGYNYFALNFYVTESYGNCTLNVDTDFNPSQISTNTYQTGNNLFVTYADWQVVFAYAIGGLNTPVDYGGILPRETLTTPKNVFPLVDYSNANKQLFINYTGGNIEFPAEFLACISYFVTYGELEGTPQLQTWTIEKNSDEQFNMTVPEYGLYNIQVYYSNCNETALQDTNSYNFEYTYFEFNIQAGSESGSTSLENCNDEGVCLDTLYQLPTVADCVTETFPFYNHNDCMKFFLFINRFDDVKNINGGNFVKQQQGCKEIITIAGYINLPPFTACPAFPSEMRLIVTPIVTFLLGGLIVKSLLNRRNDNG